MIQCNRPVPGLEYYSVLGETWEHVPPPLTKTAATFNVGQLLLFRVRCHCSQHSPVCNGLQGCPKNMSRYRIINKSF